MPTSAISKPPSPLSLGERGRVREFYLGENHDRRRPAAPHFATTCRCPSPSPPSAAKGPPAKMSEGYFRFLCPHCGEMCATVNPRNNLAHCFTCQKNLNNIDVLDVLLDVGEAVLERHRLLAVCGRVGHSERYSAAKRRSSKWSAIRAFSSYPSNSSATSCKNSRRSASVAERLFLIHFRCRWTRLPEGGQPQPPVRFKLWPSSS